MPVRVILLRGVNVGGAGRLPMAGFRQMLADLGYGDPRTCIQSGNAVLDSDATDIDLATSVRTAVRDGFGFSPEVLVRSTGDILLAKTDHPFAGMPPERVHVFFLTATPSVLDEASLRSVAAPGDCWQLSPGRFTLYTPAGIGRSKLAERLHRFLPGQMTARNLRTVAVLARMATARLTHP